MIETEQPNLRGEYEHICDFRTHAINGSYNEADARLIAASPELLSAAKLALDYLSPEHNNGHTRLWVQGMTLALRQAIEKAEGRE